MASGGPHTVCVFDVGFPFKTHLLVGFLWSRVGPIALGEDVVEIFLAIFLGGGMTKGASFYISILWCLNQSG